MARRVKPKIQYKKNKKVPKAFLGSVVNYFKGRKQKKMGEEQLAKGQAAMDDFDQSRLESKRTASLAARKLADSPIDEGYMQKTQDARLSGQASAMRNLARDPRAALAGTLGLQDQARKQELDLLGTKQDAKTKAMENLGRQQESAQRDVESQRLKVAGDEVAGIKSEMAAGQQNIYSGMENQYSAAASGLDSLVGAATALVNPAAALGSIGSGASAAGSMAQPTLGVQPSITSGVRLPGNFKEGGKINEDGGVTPGEFDHEGNPIDMVQDGEKIGEATGGELILPPDDVEDIRSALKDGDKNAAFELMEDLVAKYDSNVIGDDDSEAQEGGKVKKPTVPPLDQDRAQEIVRIMKSNADQVRNVGELPFDEDPTNPAGLVKYIGDKLSFDIDSTSKAEIDFIKNYREHLVNDKGRADSPEMKGGGYLAKVKARVGAYMKSKY